MSALVPTSPQVAQQRSCRICSFIERERFYRAREMQFGTGEEFLYFQCSSCGCLQIADFPPDLSRYYPPGYYSLGEDQNQGARGVLRRSRARYAVTGKGWLGRLLARQYPYRFSGVREWLALEGIHRDSPILDVGCGRGELLCDLAAAGYSRLTGIDPFLENDLDYPGGPRILKRSVQEMEGSFNLIMFHHSLEHIPDQKETLQAARKLLSERGYCLVRVPVASSFAWEHYRESWVQLDAPRHFFLHSVRSLELLGESVGLELSRVEFDSTEFQFTGSEHYRAGLPLSEFRNRFPRSVTARYWQRARELNEERRGDQAAFYFTAA